ncbi:MAG: hypothetical protein ACJ8IK_30010 [Burkholderiaceae bacterium]|jgi:hypothetical protein
MTEWIAGQQPGNPDYKKSLADELDLKTLDQLSAAVAQISNFCFEIKKFCVTTVVAAMTILVSLVHKIDPSMFVAAGGITFAFWFLDGVAYYYQVAIRGAMNNVQAKLQARSGPISDTQKAQAAIEAPRVAGTHSSRVRKAFFNHSMWIYALMIAADGVLAIAFR